MEKGKRSCAVEGCTNIAVSRAYCKQHANNALSMKGGDLAEETATTLNLSPNVGIDDMVMLTAKQLNEDGINDNLNQRYRSDTIYTYIGAVLVAVNPFRWIDLYNKDMIKLYANKSMLDAPPHIFGIAEAAYRGMVSEEDNQCIIISGESGAGKTEASKQIQNYIAAVSSGGKEVDHLKKVFLDSNPLLEAFGNAKTLRNNNSSRFGKYFELMFDPQGQPRGGKVNNYLLEKSRVVRPGKGERGFHIFYQLINGASKEMRKSLYLLKNPEDYAMLKRSECYTVAGINDVEEFSDTCNAMSVMNMKSKEVGEVLKLVSIVLHLGNLKMTPVQMKNTEGSQIAKDGNSGVSFKAVEQLLSSDKGSFDIAALEVALTSREMKTKDETYQVPLNVLQANAARDALAKALYASLFDFLVGRVNSALAINEETLKGVDVEDLISIGVLDIYGFEIFENNGFEQFCINYVNEKLQQIFIEIILRGEQEEYEREGIEWTAIPFFDNKVVCELIEGKRPPGLFLLLDDTCKTIHAQSEGVDDAFLQKSKGIHASHKRFNPGKGGFIVEHYAGKVRYSADGFCSSNKDTLLDGVISSIKSSSNALIKHLFKNIDLSTDLGAAKTKTMGAIISTQCGVLVDALMQCQPHYVRCMKSNDEKKAGLYDKDRMVHQVQYLGLLENIRVRRAGFAYRAEFYRFLERFKLLSKKTYPYWKGTDIEGVKAIIKDCQKRLPEINPEEVKLGKSMIFIKKPETFYALEVLRDTVKGEFAIKIQRAFRKFHSRKWFIKLKANVVDFFSTNKQRRKESIFRPYNGNYIREEDYVKGVKSIISQVGKEKSERVLFMDKIQRVVIDKASKNGVTNVNRILCITQAAIYNMEFAEEPLLEKERKNRYVAQQRVILRRRLPLDQLDGLVLSKLSDNFLVIRMTPHSKLPTPNISFWTPDKDSDTCMKCRNPFGLFTRKHHCRACGKLFCAECSSGVMRVPDLGHYDAGRVCDGCFKSVTIQQEMCEDWVIISSRKTEMVAILMDSYNRTLKKKLRVDFEDRIRPRPAAVLSDTLGVDINFRSDRTSNDDSKVFLEGANNYVVKVGTSATISFEKIESIKKEKETRRKKMEIRIQKQMQQRKKENESRAAEREKERKIRVKEKKERKAVLKQRKKESLDKKKEYSKRDSSSSITVGKDFGSMKVAKSENGSNTSIASAASEKRSSSKTVAPFGAPAGFGAPRPPKNKESS